jgi:hypothetical protein
MGNNTPTRVPFKAARGHVPQFWPLLRCAVALGALLGISVSVFTVSGRASATLSSPTTAAFIDSEPGDPLLNGGAITFSSMMYQGGGGAPRFTLFNGSGSPWQIYFAPPTTDAALVPGTYENAQFSPDATHPELSIVGGAVNSCTFGTGRFVVDDITTSAGVLQTFSARFEEHDCNGGPALFGAISYSSTADYRTRTVSPTSLSLATTGSTSTTGDVTITDNGPSALTPSGFTISGVGAGQFAITSNTCTSPLAATASCVVAVTYSPGTAPSQASATLSYYDELSPQGSPGEPDTNGTGRDIPLTGTDTPPLAASTSSLDFGEATLGTYVGPLSVVVTNTSTSEDEFNTDSDVVFSGVGANDYAAIPDETCLTGFDTVRLNPGDSCRIDVYFTPGALGSRPATFSIDDALHSGLAVALSGTGGIGYYQVSSNGAVANFGDAASYGDASGIPLNHPIVGIAQTGDDGGYWLVATDGGIFNYGDAGFFGSAGSLRLNKPIVGMAATTDGGGYWLVASDGGIFDYGDAPFFGSTGSLHLNKPIVGMAATPDGGGYWLVASDGGIFSYGDAGFYGSAGSIHLNKPIVGMAATPDGGGYWLVASDGGIFSYGDAAFYGSTGAIHLNQAINGMAAMPTGNGYWFTAADGGIFNYGDAPFQGSSSGQNLGGPVVAMTTDGVPTGQAFTDTPAVRPRAGDATGSSPVPSARRFAGP